MRIEQDLHLALAAREDLSPDSEPVLAGVRAAAAGYRRRRRTAAAGVVAAGLAVAAVVVLPAALTSGPPAPDPGSPPVAEVPVELPGPEPFDPADPRPAYSFTIYPETVAGFEIRPINVTPDYQIADILPAAGAEPVAQLVVYQPDAAVEVSVGGEVLLRWEYTPDGYAEIQGESGEAPDDPTRQRIADGLRFTAPYPVRVPYRLDYLPEGYAPFSVAQDTTGARHSTVQLERGAGPEREVMDITIADDSVSEDDPGWDWQPTVIAGRPAECADLVDGSRCRVEFDEVTVSIGRRELDAADLARIVAGINLATWADPNSWFDIDHALPSG